MAVFQGLFRRCDKFIAVKFIRLTATTRIEPGTKLPCEEYPLKPSHLRNLFRQRLIGIDGTPWAKSILGAFKARLEKESKKAEALPKPKKARKAKKVKKAEPAPANKELEDAGEESTPWS